MLRQRIITAIVLLAVLLPALFAQSAYVFILVSLLLIAPAGWEWARLAGARGALAWATALLLALLCLSRLLFGVGVGEVGGWWWAMTGLWVIGGAGALHAGPAGWGRLPSVLRWALGLLVLFAAWAAMAHARVIGINFLLSVFCIVWAADIAAYFGGRRFGRRKLAITISPGKSWEGVWSGLAGVALLAMAWLWLDRHFDADSKSIFSMLDLRLGLIPMLALVFGLAGLSVVGDLFESLLKRAAGAKDSSALLPGHGGVLDRLDALLPVLPAALAVIGL